MKFLWQVAGTLWIQISPNKLLAYIINGLKNLVRLDLVSSKHSAHESVRVNSNYNNFVCVLFFRCRNRHSNM